MGTVGAALRGAVNRLSTGVTELVRRVASSAALSPVARLWSARLDALSRRELDHLAEQRAGFRGPAPRPGASPRRAGSMPEPQVVVPDVVGRRPEQARRDLDAQGLRVHDPDLALAPPGAHVVRQYPGAGRTAPVGAVVTLWFGSGPGDAGVREPRRPDPDLRTLRGAADPGT